jgi:hypothetical protein
MQKSAKRGEPQILPRCVTLWASGGGAVSARLTTAVQRVSEPHRPLMGNRLKNGRANWPRHEGVGAFFFQTLRQGEGHQFAGLQTLGTSGGKENTRRPIRALLVIETALI